MTTDRMPPDRPEDRAPGGDYLWDRTGAADPEVVKLEELLGTLKHRGEVPRIEREQRLGWRTGLALAAVVTLAVSIAVFLSGRPRAPANASWTVASTIGECNVGDSEPLKMTGSQSGRWIKTEPGASAKLVGKGGASVTIDGAARVLLIDSGAAAQRLQLAEGTIYTEPTKSDAAIEVSTLGCSASITPDTACRVAVDAGGKGAIELKLGQVEIREKARVVRAGGGSVIPLNEKLGVGTPCRGEAAPDLQKRLMMLDQELAQGKSVKMLHNSLSEVLRLASAEDAPMLWNIMWRVDDYQRQRIIDRITELFPVLQKKSIDGVERLDQKAMDELWRVIAEP